MSDTAGRIEAIWVKRAKRGVMDATSTVELLVAKGLKDSADQRGKRQVTLLEREAWASMMEELEADVPPAARRANVMLSGIRLADTRGRILRLGGTRIRIAGETRPCERMEEACPRLQDAMRKQWRGGAFGEVLHGGLISIGDEAAWEVAAHSAEQ